MPILSAALDTVSDSRLAIAMAQHGGIGVIPNTELAEQLTQYVVEQGFTVVGEDPISHKFAAHFGMITTLPGVETPG